MEVYRGLLRGEVEGGQEGKGMGSGFVHIEWWGIWNGRYN